MSSSTNSVGNMDDDKAKDKALLTSLGYKQEFKREFTTVELFGFGFSISAPVPSASSVLVYSIANGGASAMIWGWATSSFFLMFIAMAMAELGSAAPTSGGLYYWTYRYSSPKYRNLLSWIVGYMNTISYITGVAGVDWACAVQIMAAASISSDGNFIPTVYQTFGVFCAIIICHILIASLATRVIARLQYLFITVNVLLVLVFLIALPAATPGELKNTGKFAFGNFENITPWPNGFAFILSFLAPLWSVGGFDAGVHISEEARNAKVAVPWAIICVTAIGCLLGFAIQISVAFCMGQDTIGIISNPIQQPMATVLFNSFGKRGTLAVWSFIILAQFMSGASLLISSSRQTFAFSRDGALPFSRFLYRINAHTETPVNCVCFSAFIATLLGLITFAGPAATGAIFTLGVAGQYVSNSIPIAARYLGGQQFKPGPFNLGILSLPVATVAVSWMWFMVVVLLFPVAPRPTAPTMNYTVVVLGGVLCFSMAYFYLPRYGGMYWFHGPVANVGKDFEDKNLEGRGSESGHSVITGHYI